MRCGYCGKTIPNKEKYCVYCGTVVKHRRPPWIIIVVFIFSLGLCVFLICYFTPSIVNFAFGNTTLFNSSRSEDGKTYVPTFESSDVKEIDYLSVSADDNKFYIKFVITNNEGYPTGADGSGQVWVLDRNSDELFAIKDFYFASGDFRDFLILGQPYIMMARNRNWSEMWGYFYSFPRKDSEGSNLSGRAILSIETGDGRMLTREDKCIVVYAKQSLWGEESIVESCLEQ